MSKLLRADFVRMKKSKMYWVGLVTLLGMGIMLLLSCYSSSLKYDVPSSQVLREAIFQNMIMIGIILAAFSSLFIGTEYDEGTIRNKLMIGQSRVSIYLSNFISCMGAAVFQAAVSIVCVYVVGMILCGKTDMTAGDFFQLSAALVFLCIAYVSIYNLVSMLISSKSHAATINILLSFAFLILASYLIMQLGQPEMMTQISMTADGMPMQGDQMPNPAYITGLQRDIYQFMIDFLPGGQSYQIANSSMQEQILRHPFLSCFYSVVITAVANITGICLFRRKDIK